METLRTSSYLIPVKLESEPGKYMLIHGYTGAIDIVTESLLKKIQAAASGVDLPEDTLQALIKRGYITTRSQEEEYAYVARIAKALHKKECLLHTSFTWVVTYNCNFRCPYCFEGREQKDGEFQIVFTKKMVDQAYHAMELIQPNKKLRRNVITLYGGEPLLAENKEIVSYIINEGQKRGYTFFAVTNGYDLNSYIDLFSPSAIKKIQVTIDGPKNFHNQRRIHHKYVETFDNIISNIKLVLNTGIKVSVRINTDKNNVEQISELKKQLKILGLYNYPNFSLYSAILIDNDSITKIERDKLDFVSIKSYVEKNRQNEVLELCQDYGIYKIINEAISTNRAIAFRSTYCTSQTGEYVLDPLGRIYPCLEVIGKSDYLIGTFKMGLKWDSNALAMWRGMNILKKESCRMCRYALICGGGCPFSSIIQNKSHCTSFYKMFETSINRIYQHKKAELFF